MTYSQITFLQKRASKMDSDSKLAALGSISGARAEGEQSPVVMHTGITNVGVSEPSQSDQSISGEVCSVHPKISVFAGNSDAYPITAAEYGTLQEAYNYFSVLFGDDRLPQVLITLQHQRRARGYFSAKKFRHRDKTQEKIHEVALNPDAFTDRTDEEILSTLVHEMVHVWQQEYGNPGRGRYHNREWARKMHSIGLMPSNTGKRGGAETGDSMSHYILEDGRFIAACRAFLTRYRLVWESATGLKENVKTQKRVKFSCPNGHDLNAWAKPGALIDCHLCSIEAREPVLLVAQSEANGEVGRPGFAADRRALPFPFDDSIEKPGLRLISRANDVILRVKHEHASAD